VQKKFSRCFLQFCAPCRWASVRTKHLVGGVLYKIVTLLTIIKLCAFVDTSCTAFSILLENKLVL
jgi:hypothetical protein